MSNVTPINWAAVKSDYMFGKCLKDGQVKRYTAGDLAKKYGCAVSTIHTRSAKESWNDIRQQYLKDIEEEVAKKKKNKLVDKVLEFDESVFTIACYAIRILEDKMLIEKIYKDKKGKEFKEKVVNLDCKVMDVQRIMASTKIAQEIRSNALGDIRVNASEDSINQLVDVIENERMKAANE